MLRGIIIMLRYLCILLALNLVYSQTCLSYKCGSAYDQTKCVEYTPNNPSIVTVSGCNEGQRCGTPIGPDTRETDYRAKITAGV